MESVIAHVGGATTVSIWGLRSDVQFVYPLWHMIAEPRQAVPPKRDCPAGVRARVERPKQLEINGNEEAAAPGE